MAKFSEDVNKGGGKEAVVCGGGWVGGSGEVYKEAGESFAHDRDGVTACNGSDSNGATYVIWKLSSIRSEN